MNEQPSTVFSDEQELEMQEAEARKHRAALLFSDSVRLDLLLEDEEDDDFDDDLVED